MLSPRQHDTYQFILGYLERHGKAPLLSEIASGLGISSKGVIHRYLQALANEGLIQVENGRHRGITLAGAPATSSTLPLLGRIAAGRPIEAISGEEEINLADFFIGPNRFVLKVSGNSMEEAGILDGDMVVVERCEQASDGDIVVALIDREEATLKRLQRNNDGTITLLPANATMAPLHYSAERVAIQGRLVGQMRRYR
jgi:repressor LexA